jgi:hypothetical protein
MVKETRDDTFVTNSIGSIDSGISVIDSSEGNIDIFGNLQALKSRKAYHYLMPKDENLAKLLALAVL